MNAIRIYNTVEHDGEILLASLPLKRGQRVEMIVLPEPAAPAEHPPLTAADLLASGLVGQWEEREDMADSSVFGRQLRDHAQHCNSA